MTKTVFISTSTLGRLTPLESALIEKLKEEHTLYFNALKYDESVGYRRAFSSSDIFFVIVTEDYLNSPESKKEFNYIASYVEANPEKLLIVASMASLSMPAYIANSYSHTVFLAIPDLELVDDSYEELQSSISKHSGKIAAKKEIAFKKNKVIETKAAEYVVEAIKELKEREEALKKQSNFWYKLGYLTISVGAITAITFSSLTFNHFLQSAPAWDFVVFTGIKSIVLLGFLLGGAKYSLSLGKSYTEEALKNADRIHAISFGKFYLQAFGDEAQQSDIKEIFQHWNIRGANSFSALNTDSIEPKILETAFEFAKTMSNNTKKT